MMLVVLAFAALELAAGVGRSALPALQATAALELAARVGRRSAPPALQATADLVITFKNATRPATHAAAGLLHGTGRFNLSAMSDQLAPLQISSYRGNEAYKEYATLVRLGVRNVQAIVGGWWYRERCAPNCSAPGQAPPGKGGDWAPFETWLRNLTAHKPGPLLWYDIWNEPNVQNPLGWPAAANWGVPDADWLEMWRRAVLQIRATDKTTKILGPSTNAFDFSFLTSFLSYAANHSVLPDILNWHELQNTNGSEIPAHHEQMRAWLRQELPSVVAIPIAHNEIVPENARLYAARTLGALAGAERAGAVSCVHSNWWEHDASNATGVQNPFQSCPLDELITCDDQPFPRSPRSTWWVYRAYANTSGVMLGSERRCDDADVLASYDDAHGVANGEPTAWAVLGYYGAASGRTVRLRWDSVPTALQRRHADGSRSVRVTVALIRNTLQEHARGVPTPLSDAAIPLVGDDGGSLSVAVELGSQDVATVRLRLPSGAT
jgi:hypothetical protein